MTYEELTKRLKALDLSFKDFSRLCDLHHNSVLNWGQTQKVLGWVENFLNFYEKSVKFDALVKHIKECQKMLKD